MTPVAQQSTGLPYRCLPTTSGATQENKIINRVKDVATFHIFYFFNILTQVFWGPTGIFD